MSVLYKSLCLSLYAIARSLTIMIYSDNAYHLNAIKGMLLIVCHVVRRPGILKVSNNSRHMPLIASLSVG